MSGPPTLDALGPRLCIMGPSNSGKSTLAAAIGRARGLSAVHLDQLHHRPHTDWLPRSAAEFAALHEKAVRGDRWVIEGNYSRLLSRRLERATGLILLDVSTPDQPLSLPAALLGRARSPRRAGGRAGQCQMGDDPPHRRHHQG